MRLSNPWPWLMPILLTACSAGGGGYSPAQTDDLGSGGDTGQAGSDPGVGGSSSGTGGTDPGAGGSGAGPSGAGGTSGGAAGVGGSGAGGSNAAGYPQGTYGVTQGALLNPNKQFNCYAGQTATTTPLSIPDLFDPDGSKGIKAIVITQSATWCGVCQGEAKDMPNRLAGPWADGVKIVQLMVENGSHGPASDATAQQWSTNFGATWDVCADPAKSYFVPGNNGLPINLIVDPKTMEICQRFNGDGPGVVQAAQLLTQLGHCP